MPKKSRIGLSVDYNLDDFFITIKVKEGDTVLAESAYVSEGLPEHIRHNIELYGLSKILQDRTSDITDKRAKLEAMDEVYEMFEQGTWKKERKAGAPVVSAEVEALANLKGVSVAAIQKARKGYTKEQWAAIVSNEAVREEAAKIVEARKSEQDVANLDDLLA